MPQSERAPRRKVTPVQVVFVALVVAGASIGAYFLAARETPQVARPRVDPRIGSACEPSGIVITKDADGLTCLDDGSGSPYRSVSCGNRFDCPPNWDCRLARFEAKTGVVRIYPGDYCVRPTAPRGN